MFAEATETRRRRTLDENFELWTSANSRVCLWMDSLWTSGQTGQMNVFMNKKKEEESAVLLPGWSL